MPQSLLLLFLVVDVVFLSSKQFIVRAWERILYMSNAVYIAQHTLYRWIECMHYIVIMEWQTRTPFFVMYLNLNNNDDLLVWEKIFSVFGQLVDTFGMCISWCDSTFLLTLFFILIGFSSLQKSYTFGWFLDFFISFSVNSALFSFERLIFELLNGWISAEAQIE